MKDDELKGQKIGSANFRIKAKHADWRGQVFNEAEEPPPRKRTPADRAWWLLFHLLRSLIVAGAAGVYFVQSGKVIPELANVAFWRSMWLAVGSAMAMLIARAIRSKVRRMGSKTHGYAEWRRKA